MIYNKEINGVKFTLVCESWNNRTSWGHKVTLYRNYAVIVGTYKVRYHNRTWEEYLYQSVIKGVIYNVLEALKATLKNTFKKLHGYKVITQKRALEFVEYLKQDKEYSTYSELYRMF